MARWTLSRTISGDRSTVPRVSARKHTRARRLVVAAGPGRHDSAAVFARTVPPVAHERRSPTTGADRRQPEPAIHAPRVVLGHSPDPASRAPRPVHTLSGVLP